MLKVKTTALFRRDYKLLKKRKFKTELLEEVTQMLAEGKTLPEKYNDHALTGKYKGCRECHIQPDWLLIYEIYKREVVLVLSRTGTHSDLF